MDISLCLCFLKAQLSSEHASITQNRKESKIFYLALKLIHLEPLALFCIRPTYLTILKEQLKPSDFRVTKSH